LPHYNVESGLEGVASEGSADERGSAPMGNTEPLTCPAAAQQKRVGRPGVRAVDMQHT
jgi:hypothetical protein